MPELPRFVDRRELVAALSGEPGISPVELTAQTLAYWRSEVAPDLQAGNLVWRIAPGVYGVCYAQGPADASPLRACVVSSSAGTRRTVGDGHATLYGQTPCVFEISGGIVDLLRGERMR